ncbi:uncharacterized protein LOC100367273 [Saccoglossus kowalevskii]|uniref:Tumor necrosis factor receptor superfamily member 21-like n=1 Tax=Saccoglossus kowalevskii TaxID=10224 RepID=A0ABM0GTD6_SACKO|nr:PREDICTED: tumor necrosis factor receptor superfamily member 21-like [Saccoglossus kowalevskii]
MSGKSVRKWWHGLFFLILLTTTSTFSDVGLRCYKKDSDKRTFKLDNGLTCDLCEPGNYMTQSCTVATVTSCSRCDEGLYMPYYNSCPSCWVCSENCSGRNQVVVQNCDGVHEQKCGCLPGTYPIYDSRCTRQSCPPGERVSLRAQYGFDVRCRRCPKKTYSSTINSRTSCTPRTDCSALGQIFEFTGNSTHDAVCAEIPALAPLPPEMTATVAASVKENESTATASDDNDLMDDSQTQPNTASLNLPRSPNSIDALTPPYAASDGTALVTLRDGYGLTESQTKQPVTLAPVVTTNANYFPNVENGSLQIIVTNANGTGPSDEENKDSSYSTINPPNINRITKRDDGFDFGISYISLIGFLAFVVVILVVALWWRFCQCSTNKTASTKKYGLSSKQKKKLQRLSGCCAVNIVNSDSELEERHSRRRSVGQTSSCRTLLQKNITLKDGISIAVMLQETAPRIRRRYWKRFMRKRPCPGLSDADIDGVEYKCRGEDLGEVVYECLKIWKNRAGTNLSVRNLLWSLADFDNDLAKDLLEMYCQVEQVANSSL